jgi:non-ribosomal peptide synthetase component E (peptide arylation enzyme)
VIQPLPLTSAEKAREYRARGFWRDETIAQRFRRIALLSPAKVAIVDGDRRITYQEALERVDNISRNLLTLGLEAGGVVGFQAPNCAEFVLMHLATHQIGRLFLPLHDSWRHTEIQHLMGRTKAGVIVVPGVYREFDHAAMISQIRSDLPALQHCFRLDGATPGFGDFAVLTKPGRAAATDLRPEMPDPDAPAAIMLSGGTTAMSKVSRYSSNNLLCMLGNFATAIELTQDDVAAALAPCGTGATGYVYPILAPLLWGATSVILHRWHDPGVAIDLIVRERCTYAVGIPTQLTRMVPGLMQRTPGDFTSLRAFANAGAPLPFETAKNIETLMGCRIQTVYGATDGGTPTMTHISDPEDQRLRTVGRVVPGFECELRDPRGEQARAAESGEIYWRGPDKSWGYLADEEATAKAFTPDNFYISGDLGAFDGAGYLKIIGRVRDMILRGGRNISPITVEEQLIKHPSVLEVAVAAMPDPELGERACAFVVLKANASLTFDEEISFLQQCHLAVWQLPERIEVMDDLPRSTGGKVAKAQLTALVTRKLQQEKGL